MLCCRSGQWWSTYEDLDEPEKVWFGAFDPIHPKYASLYSLDFPACGGWCAGQSLICPQYPSSILIELLERALCTAHRRGEITACWTCWPEYRTSSISSSFMKTKKSYGNLGDNQAPPPPFCLLMSIRDTQWTVAINKNICGRKLFTTESVDALDPLSPTSFWVCALIGCLGFLLLIHPDSVCV